MIQSPATPQSADDLICAALRGEGIAFAELRAVSSEALLERAKFHGVEVLMHAIAKPGQWPDEVARPLRQSAVRRAMWELRHQQILAETLAKLETHGIQPILIKGTALAYSLYADPALRTRGDTDLIIPPPARQKVHELLLSLGYDRSIGMSGDFVSYQASYTKLSPEGDSHTLDLHWKINNSEVLSRLFTYDELRRDAHCVPGLCAHALAASPVHALLLACMHRSTHKHNPYYVDGHAHHSANRLIWLYDLHLLTQQLSARQWNDFLELAQRKGLRAVCLDGMMQAGDCIGTAYPVEILTRLAQPGPREEPASYLDGSKLRRQWMDFEALGTVAKQLSFLHELVFPPPVYMRGRYLTRSWQYLPWLYLRRMVGGLIKALLRRSNIS